jgi:hypothetical protein
MKTGKVVKCKFTKQWKSPMGAIVYYHDVVLDNGDMGTCGRAKECPDDMKVGRTIEYEMSDNKIKFISQHRESKHNREYSKHSHKKNPSEFLGYAYSYAKDLVIAGKTQEEDMMNLKAIAEGIYFHIVELLEKKDEEKEEDAQKEIF